MSSQTAPNVTIALKCFQPSFTSKGASGIHDTSFRCFMKSDADIRKELHANIVSSGSKTTFQGKVERMAKELTALAPR